MKRVLSAVLASTAIVVACGSDETPVGPEPATQLTFSMQPTNANVNQAISPAIQVEVRDASGALVTTATDAVTLSIGTNPGTGTLSGTQTVNAVGGVATFSDLSIDEVGMGYTLVAASGSLAGATSAAFDVAPGPPTQLGFLVQPTDATAGTAFPVAVQLVIQDAAGTRVTTAADAITLSIGTNPGTGTLSGTQTVNAVGGVATFSGLSIDKAGTGYTLVAASGSLAGVTSAAFDISPGAPDRLAFVTQPSDGEGNVAIAPAVQVSIVDAFGNPVPSAGESATVSIGTDPWASVSEVGSGVLSGALTVSLSGGIATFGDLSLDKPGSGYTLVATVGALLPDVTSTAFDIGLSMQSVTAGHHFHTCGVAVGGTYCWGNNDNSQLGASNSIRSEELVAVLVRGGHTFIQVSAGQSNSCGLTAAGAAHCWGFNGQGQLGDGSTIPSDVPVAVLGGHSFASIDAGERHVCAVLRTATAGNAYCWGNNSNGELGDNSQGDSTTPVQVAGGHTFIQVSAAQGHSCGVDSSGNAWCWGGNLSGRLGDGTMVDRLAPVQVSGALTFSAVSAGSDHTCGVTTGLAAYCWGGDHQGQLGNDAALVDQTTPVQVFGGLSWGSVEAGGGHTCGVTTGNFGFCWGDNIGGQLGDGLAPSDSPLPSAVAGGLLFTSISASFRHSCGLVGAGNEVYCWGENALGQLGDATRTQRNTPMRIVQ